MFEADAELRDFESDVMEASHSQPILADFWAPWCQPCNLLGPTLEDMASRAEGRWRLVKINVDQNPDLAQRFGIQGIPAVKLFHEGNVVGEFMGALPEGEIQAWLEQHLPTSDSGSAVDSAASGRLDEARDRLRQEPAAVLAILDGLEEPGQDDEGEELGESDEVTDLRTLAQLLVASPDRGSGPVWERYREGVEAFRRGDDETALRAWIEVVSRDRKLDEDGARRACVALFRFLGEEDPLTQQLRRSFSSALY